MLESIDLVALTRTLLDDAGTLGPPRLGSLDTIHLAAAQRATGALRSVVTYDNRMAQAATELGMVVVAPI
ncbi:MAG: hypothetical protein ACSLE6_13800 [Mycobacterium sp.]